MKTKLLLLILLINLVSCNRKFVSHFTSGPEISLLLNTDSTFEYLYNFMGWETGFRQYSFGTFKIKENDLIELNSVKFDFNKIPIKIIEKTIGNIDSTRIILQTCFNNIEEGDFNTIIYLDSKPLNFIGTSIDTTFLKFEFKKLKVIVSRKDYEKNLLKPKTSVLQSVYYTINNQNSNLLNITFTISQDDFFFQELNNEQLINKRKYYILESGLKVSKFDWPFSKCKRL